MKKILSIALTTGLLSIAVFAQTSAKPEPAASTTPAPAAAAVTPAPKPKPSPFPREKFDPLRDPKVDLKKAVALARKTYRRIILDVGGDQVFRNSVNFARS
jgi:hypothetical protein